jgi:hypothetical protein
MSWDGIYAKDRNYPIFEVGDEVFTTNDSWPRITPNKPYQVVKCQKKHGMTIDIYIITVITDTGSEGEYASYQFQKTESQLREDKLKSILC